MAQVEPMDVDGISTDFDDKENSLQNGNVLPKTPSTEKGYEDLDVSELNMKLRYSMTPASSPMSRSFTANSKDNNMCDDDSSNTTLNDSGNLTWSLNSTITKMNSSMKSSKFPLQALSTEQFLDGNGNPINRSLDIECHNVTLTLTGSDNIEDNLSLPSNSSSMVNTPEATTPTKEIPKDSGSPILRGLKSVLNMFRPSQSPVSVEDTVTNNLASPQKKEDSLKHTTSSPSTPTTVIKNKENNSRSNSSLKESVVFHDDLEKELSWKDDTGIVFKEEKIPIHKLLFKSNSTVSDKTNIKPIENENMNNTVEYMDVSFDNSLVENNKTITEDVHIQYTRDRRNTPESDCEFLDCESYTKNDSKVIEDTIQMVSGVTESSQNSPKPSLQPENIICESNACPQVVCNSIEQTYTAITNNEIDVKKEETDLNYKQNLETDLLKAEIIIEPTNNINISNEIIQENIPKDQDLHDSLHCDNKTINLNEDIKLVLPADIKHDSHVTSNEINNTSQCVLDNSLDRVEIIQTNGNNEMKDEMISKQNCDELLRSVHLTTDNPSVSSECLGDDEQNNVRLEEEQEIITKFEENICIESEIKEVPEIVQPCEEEINENKETDSSNQKVIMNVSEFNEVVKSPEQVPLPCDSEDFNNEQPEKEINNTTINYSTENTNLNESYSQENTNTAIPVENIKGPENITISSENTLTTETSHLEVLNNTENFNTEMNSPNNSIVNDTMTCPENDVLIQETDLNKEAPLDNAVDALESRTEDSKNLLNSNLSPVVDSSDMGQKTENHSDVICVSNAHVNNEETIDDNCVRIDESIPLCDNMSVTKAETNEYTSENKSKFTLTLQKNTSEIDDKADLKLDPANNLLDVNNKNEETLEIISPSAISNTTIEMEEYIAKRELENIENPFETVNKLTSSFEIKSSIISSQVEKEQDFAESILDNHESEEAKEMKTTETVINTTTDMEVDLSKHDSESNLNPFETINKLTSSFEIGSTSISSKIEKQQDFSESLLEQHKTEESNAMNPTETAINTTIDMVVDLSEYFLDSNLNPFETINKLTSSFEIKSAEIDGNVDLKLDSANSSLDVNHTNKNTGEESVPEAIINTTIDMEVDVSKHDLEINMNSLKTNENDHISPVKEPLDTPVENEIVNKIDLKTNDQLNETTACDNIIGTEEVVSNCNIDNIETLKENNLSAGTFDTRISTSDNKELVIGYAVETTSTTNDNVQDAIISSANCDDDSTETVEHELATAKENLENQFETKIVERCSPPISSMLRNTGYNINFDDIGDPFATKSNIRMSPPPSVIEDNFVNNEPKEKRTVMKKPQLSSRRKSCQERKKPNIGKKSNASFDCVINSNKTFDRIQESPIIPEGDQDDNRMDDIIKEKDDFVDPHMKIEENVQVNQSVSTNSTSKNVFNLPEIHDINFNPFATKTKIRLSPDKQSENISNYTHDRNDFPRSELQEAMVNKDETFNVEENNAQVSEKNLTSNLSNVTCSSPNTKNETVREVHTEDEDTEEGPFLEAEDFADFVKVTDIEIEKDMMNFDDLPTQSNNDDNNENGEMFIDAEAFEFLLNQNKSNMVADSGKESLFLKFDPLFAKRVSSDGVVAALNKIKNRQSTPKKPTPLKPIVQEDSPSPEHSTITIGTAPVAGEVVEDPVATTFKPMMVVNPAVASIVSPRKSTTPPRANRRSLNITSPAMAVIDRLLSLSGNSSRLDEASSVPLPRHYNETDFALTQLRELLAEKEINVHNLRLESKELKERLANMETQVQSLEHESKERLRKVNELNERLTEKNAINKSLAAVVEEYERTIARLIAGMEQDRKRNAEERQRIISERDEQTAHLASMEVSFRDLHSKYEKSKQIILNMKANEDKYRKSLKTFEDNLLKMQNNYELLKQHATSKLNHANQELEKYNRSHEAEVLKLNAMIKRKELHITSLEESLSQKTKANEELTAICDELINKVG
ncbi:unnamed protein product [Danaus chrysippus]|uniref:(African queen) hypothetical protein n=1 Tax=Danaus chrysippus TaxID=151541 RepID=A0A8J2QM51_9NEOP|nr:unnamed protein product [Danaus chrysippus]